LKVVDANLRELQAKKAPAAEQAREKKFRDGLNKQIASIKQKANLLAGKSNKASLTQLVKLNKSQAKFNAK